MANIAIDIDEVLAEFVRAYINYVNKREPKQITFEDMKSYRFWEAYNIPKEKVYDYGSEIHQSELFDNLEVVQGAKEGVSQLQEEHKIIFLTARNIKVKEQTYSFIKNKIGITNPNIYFSSDDYHNKNESKTKGEICEEQKIDYLIEDNIDFFKEGLGNGTRVILLNKPWNQELEHEHLYRCNDWTEILKTIKELEA